MSIEEREHEPIREISGRCSHCGRSLKGSVHSIVRGTDAGEQTRTDFCGQRAACRRAWNEQYDTEIPVSGGSSEALGSALIAGDYVLWPWWGRLLPGSMRDELRYRFAKAMSAAVEHRTRLGPHDEDTEDAARDQHAELAYMRTGTDCCCLEPGATCPACLLGEHLACLDSSDRTGTAGHDEPEDDDAA